MRNFFARLKDRTIWSWAGLVATWRDEYSFRTWVWANLISAALALSLPLSAGERALILALGLLVLVVELFNTAIERAVDFTSTERHELAGQAKDAASAAVALTALAAGVAWLMLLLRVFWG
ncbi:MAG: diacylglycerol kinase [Paracoccaceae bacterium]